jgi:hypothetical protein
MLALGALMVLVYFLLLPGLRPATPLPYATPFVRLFIVFLAGAGFQRALDARPAAPLRFAGSLLLAGAVLLGLLCWTSIRRPDLAHDLLALTVAGESTEAAASPVLEPWIYPDQLRFSLVSDLLGASCLFASLGGGLLLLLAGRSRSAPLALSLILLVHPLDAFSWKFRMSWLETFPANASQRALQKLEAPPYSPRRLASIADAPRYREFHRSVGDSPNPAYAPRFPDGGLSNGYWQADAGESPGAASGDKIRIYAKAHSLPEPEIARRLAQLGLDRLYIAGDAEAADAAGSSSDLLPLAPVVESFGCNGIRLRVESVPAGAWLSYADAWNSGWTASVNGATRSIARGNLAGKALPLDAGTNLVEFRFRSPIRTLSFFLVALNSLAWLLWTLRAVFLLAWHGGEQP